MATRGGYRCTVTLVSPDGETKKIILPGRYKSASGEIHSFSFHSGGRLRERAERRFYRFLSAGWKVIQHGGSNSDSVREEQKKNTDVVIGTTQTGQQSHGGEHASCEVKDSPNRAKRGCRGGRKKKRHLSKKERRSKNRPDTLKRTRTGAGVWTKRPLQPKKSLLESAEKSAELLAKIVGQKFQQKMRAGITVDPYRLLVALETGNDPLPALETPNERPKVKILVTPDCSGSTQNWNGLGQAWALHLSKLPEVDVIYLENFNGSLELKNPGKQSEKLISSVDIVLYLGDGDGNDLCKKYASQGAIVIALDCYCAQVGKPRLKTEEIENGVLHWVDRVDVHTHETWVKAIGLAIQA